MKLRAFLLALIAWAALGAPALAAIAVASKSAHVNSSSATLSSSSQSFTAGNLIAVAGTVRLTNTTDTFSVAGSVSGAMTLYECPNSASLGSRSFVAWVPATGGAETVTLTASASAVALFINLLEISGQATSSPEDASVRACNSSGGGGATTAPTVTSGTPSQAGDLILSPLGRAASSAGYSYTEDAGNGWTQIGAVGGSTNVTYAIGYQVNAGSGAVTHAPTTSNATYAMLTIGFKVAGGGGGTPVRRGALLGVGQ